jgi:hypothetical protein
MGDCEKLANCAFFKTYQNDENVKYALKGFVRLYCQGDKQDQCIRKQVSKTLGGPEHVPVNMMPNGFPLTGTSSENWPAEVMNLVKV